MRGLATVEHAEEAVPVEEDDQAGEGTAEEQDEPEGAAESLCNLAWLLLLFCQHTLTVEAWG